MSYNNKLVLGTVQFGIDYGINNSLGKVKESEVSNILKLAQDTGIDTVDTARAYGTSEDALGGTGLMDQFNVVTKLPRDVKYSNQGRYLNQSLEKLGLESVYALMLHDSECALHEPKLWEQLQEEKLKGVVGKIGYSLYEPRELEVLLENSIFPDIVQIPFNIFDRKFDAYLEGLKSNDVEIHVRSAFLQGLFFKDPESLPEKLTPLKPALISFKALVDKYRLSISEACMNFVIDNPFIDKLVIGVDSTDQLEENVKNSKIEVDPAFYEELSAIDITNKELLNPVNWS